MNESCRTANLNEAARDLRYLLGQGYPWERSLSLVGDRHNLNATERELLRRAVQSPQTARLRREKLRGLEEIEGRPLALDGHNIIITLESALSGRLLVRGDDGVIRDIARAAKSYKISELTGEAVEIILECLTDRRASEAVFFLDEPVSHSGRLAAMIRQAIESHGLTGGAWAVPVPENDLKPFGGLVASSDGELIEACAEPIDLGGLMIDERLAGGRIGKVRLIELEN